MKTGTIHLKSIAFAIREKLSNAGLMLITLLALSGLAWSQTVQQNGALLVSGQPGQVPVLQMNSRSYVEVEALARLINGSLSFKGNQIILTLPAAAASTPAAAAAASPACKFRVLERIL